MKNVQLHNLKAYISRNPTATVSDYARHEEELLHEEFITHTGYLFDWSECEGVMSSFGGWVPKDKLTLREAVKLIKEDGYTPIPF